MAYIELTYNEKQEHRTNIMDLTPQQVKILQRGLENIYERMMEKPITEQGDYELRQAAHEIHLIFKNFENEKKAEQNSPAEVSE